MTVLFIVAVDTVISPIIERDPPPVEYKISPEESTPTVQPVPTARVRVEEASSQNTDPLFGWDIQNVAYKPMTENLSDLSLSDGQPLDEIRGTFGVSAEYLESRLPGPLKKYSHSFVGHGQRYEINPIFLAAIARHETGNGTSRVFRTKNNAMGVSNRDGARYMKSVDYSIEYMAKRLASPTGYYRKCHTIEQFADVYAPSKVKVKNDPTGLNRHWPSKVRYYMNEMLPTLAQS